MGSTRSLTIATRLLLLLAASLTLAAAGLRRRAEWAESNSADLPLQRVLRSDAFVHAFEAGGFPAPFPPVVVLEVGQLRREGRSPTCQASWEDAKAIGGKMDEKLQEVGMLRFLSQFYPHTEEMPAGDITEDGPSNSTFYYLPLCCWAEAFVSYYRREDGGVTHAPNQSHLLLPMKERGRVKHTQRVAISLFDHRVHSEEVVNATFGVLQVIPGGRVFLVIPNGMMIPSWETPMVRVRALRVDSTKYGSPLQGILPQSTSEENCPHELPIEDPQISRPVLLSAVGVPRVHEVPYKGVFTDLRPDVYKLLGQLSRKRGVEDIDAVLERTPENYAHSFFRSKFCFVLPGDSQSTSQSSRSMCGGCVPIFVAPEPRDLPFANILDYNAFSVLIDPTDVTRPGRMRELYDRLHELVRSGEYERLRQHVRIARPFFNYHRFDAMSPYGAALMSMLQDEQSKFA